MRIEIEQQHCSGCRLCQQICTITHFQEINPKKSAIKIKPEFPVPGIFVPNVCDQCGECALVCPADAIMESNGAYLIDTDLCTGCELCVEACPSESMHVIVGVAHPVKCDLCLKCTEVCNTGALRAHGEAQIGKEVVRCTDSVERHCA